MERLNKEFDYKPKWRIVLIVVLFGLVGGAAFGIKARDNDRGADINGIIRLGKNQATAFYWGLCAICLVFVLIGVGGCCHRLFFRQRLIFGPEIVIVPRSRWSQEYLAIRYSEIRQIFVTKQNGVSCIHVAHTGGKNIICSIMLTSDHIFKEIYSLLSQAVEESKPTQTTKNTPLL